MGYLLSTRGTETILRNFSWWPNEIIGKMGSGGVTGDKQVMKKTLPGTLWTAEGREPLLMVLCLSAEKLRNLRG